MEFITIHTRSETNVAVQLFVVSCCDRRLPMGFI
jgi:hypothetical protein